MQNIAIRLAVLDGDKARRELSLTGESGQKALAKIREATAPASKSLLAVNVVSEQLRYGMEGLAGSSGSLGGCLSRLGPMGLVAAAAIGTVTLAVASGIREFKEAEQALNQLNAALAATDFTSGVTVSEITALGEAIEGNTLFKKEDIQQAASALTSFQNISGTVFTRALRLSADLAVRLGTDIPSAADMLGKSLEAPQDGLGRLARKFSDLSPTQKEAIDNFLKQGKVALAQAVILEHLESKTKGLAESQAKGLTGAANSLSDAWDDLLESFGRTVSESGIAESGLHSLAKAVRALQIAIAPTKEQLKGKLENDIKELEGSFAVKLDKMVFGSSPAIDDKKEQLKKVSAEIAAEQKQQAEEQQKADAAAEIAAKEHTQDLLAELAKHNQKTGGTSGKNSEDTALENRKKAIEEINKEVLRSKPSYEQAKQALDDWKQNLINNLGGASEANQQYLSELEQIYNFKLKEIYDKSLEDSDKWQDGASRALKKYAQDAGDAAKNAEEIFTHAAQSIEDTLVDMASTGEVSMKKLGDVIKSISEDILRSVIRQQITAPLADGLNSALSDMFKSGASSGLSSILSSFFHEGGIVGESATTTKALPKALFANAPRLHKGLMPDEFPAILQKGEMVIPKNKINRNQRITNTNPVNIVFNITTPNAQSFQDSQGQIMAKYGAALERHRMRNG